MPSGVLSSFIAFHSKSRPRGILHFAFNAMLFGVVRPQVPYADTLCNAVATHTSLAALYLQHPDNDQSVLCVNVAYILQLVARESHFTSWGAFFGSRNDITCEDPRSLCCPTAPSFRTEGCRPRTLVALCWTEVSWIGCCITRWNGGCIWESKDIRGKNQLRRVRYFEIISTPPPLYKLEYPLHLLTLFLIPSKY